MRILGYIFSGIILLIIGYSLGSVPTNDEMAKENRNSDIAVLSDKYNQLYTLCEQKYQTALDGDYYEAIRINGQMDSVNLEIDRILGKYTKKAL